MPSTSTQIRDSLAARLKAKAGISDQEPCLQYLGDYLDEALVEHSGVIDPDFTVLPKREQELVILLGWVRVCEFRASNAAPQPSLRGFGSGAQAGAGFGGDRDTPFKKSMDMAKYLRDKYTDLRALLESGDDDGSGDITVGELYRRDELIDASVPFHTSPGLQAPLLSFLTAIGVTAGGADQGCAIFEWPATLAENFSLLTVFRASQAGIRQMWNADGVSGVPFILPTASKVYETSDNIAKGLKEKNLAAGTYYYVIVVKDTSGVWSFSNEVAVVVPA